MREFAQLHQHKRQGVADDDHRRGAGARSQAQRTNLVERPQDQGDVRPARQGAVPPARHRHHRRRQLPQRGEQTHNFLAFAAVRQGQHHVVLIDHAQIAVDRTRGVHESRRGCPSNSAYPQSFGRCPPICRCR